MKKTLIFATIMLIAAIAQAETRTISANTTIENETIVADGSNPAIIVKSGKVLTLNNVTVSSKAATGTIVLLNKAQLVVNGGSISNTNDKNYGAAAVFTYATTATHPTSTYYPNVITINGAKLSGQWGITLNCGSSTVNMADGEIAAGEYGIVIFASNANLNISGGKLTNIVRTSSGSVQTKVTGGAYADMLATTYYDNTKLEFSYAAKPYIYQLGAVVPKGFEVVQRELVGGGIVALDVVDAKPPASGKVTKYATTLTIGGVTQETVKQDEATVDGGDVFKQMSDNGAKVATVTVQAEDEEGNKGEEVTQAYIEVDSSAEDTTLAVPFKGMKVDDILETENLTEGDEISVYNPASGKYQTFALDANKKWYSTTPGGAITTVAQGSTVILHRKDTNAKIRMKGQVAKEGTTVASAKAPEAGATATYTEAIANPQTTEMNLTETMTGTPKQYAGLTIGDELIVQQDDGKFKVYRHTANGWAYVSNKVVNGRPKQTLTKEDPIVKPGRSFYYRSNGGTPKFTK